MDRINEECDCDERSGITAEGVRMLFDPDHKWELIPPPVVEMLRQHVLDSFKPIPHRSLRSMTDVSATSSDA